MFKFLFRKDTVEAVKETQRQTVERALAEVNEVLGSMSVRAKVAVDLETGLLEVALPEQMPDEALALPAPTPKEVEAAQDDSMTKDIKTPEDTQKAAS